MCVCCSALMRRAQQKSIPRLAVAVDTVERNGTRVVELEKPVGCRVVPTDDANYMVEAKVKVEGRVRRSGCG